MDRNNFEEHISAYIDNELSKEDRKSFEELLESDSECREIYNGMNQLVQKISSLPKLETNANFRVKLNRQIDNYEKSNISIVSKLKRLLLPDNILAKPAIGLSISCAAVVIIFYMSFNSTSDNSGLVLTPSDSEDEIYYSNIDSTDTEQYENDIELTKGVDERE